MPADKQFNVQCGASLPAILKSITNWAELHVNDGFFASVLLTDEQGKRLLHAAPSLPAHYNQAIHGLAVGPEAGCCGTAAYLKETVSKRYSKGSAVKRS
ncbi:MAG TPA: hypothetical protein VD996_17430 [Chitinophagaceae bacterium]|nr:hypothetical protein [Chitinophagaceae bacterium]